MKRKTIVIFAVIWMVLVVATASSALTLSVSTKKDIYMGEDNKYALLDDILEFIKANYYEEVDEDVLIEGAVRGLFTSLDEYSFYYSPEEMQEMLTESEGVYYGIGVLVSLEGEGGIRIVRVYKGPARDAGIIPGDVIIAIDGDAINAHTAQDLTDATDKIKAESKEPVTLTINREGEIFDVDVMRDEVEAERTRMEILDGEIGYLEITEFYGNVTSEVERALKHFDTNGIDKMVLDMRSNPGGDFYAAVDIADMLLPEGVIVTLKDRAGNVESYDSEASYNDIEMVVLINEMSASATEILSGALQDYDRAYIMGTKSFGKGIVQDVLTIPYNGAGFQVTTASYFRPSGEAVHKVGITPDEIVELSEDYDPYNFNVDPDNDNQLAAAINYLKNND